MPMYSEAHLLDHSLLFAMTTIATGKQKKIKCFIFSWYYFICIFDVLANL